MSEAAIAATPARLDELPHLVGDARVEAGGGLVEEHHPGVAEERLRQADRVSVDEVQKSRIAALATDFPRLWQDPQTPDREKKRMVRLLIEDVTLLKREQINMHVRFKGGRQSLEILSQ